MTLDEDAWELVDLDEHEGMGDVVDPEGAPLAGSPGDDMPDPWGPVREALGARRRRASGPPQGRYRPLVQGAPVVGFTGANGAGKTLVAVSECIQDMKAGRRVVSTVPIEYHGLRSEPLLSLRQLLDLRDCTILIDEVSVVFSSRATGTLPDEIVTFLQSMRHQRVTMRWTAPAWMRADVMLREVTQVVVGVHALMPYRVKGEFWRKPRLVLAGALDTVGIPTDATPTKIVGRRIWRPKRMPGWGAYDSEADVSRIGWARQSRHCVDCGGTRRPEPCSPERHQRLGIEVVS